MAKNKIKNLKKFKNFKPQKGAHKVTSKPFKQLPKLEAEDLVFLQICFYKKDNAILRKTQLESRIRISQLEAQNAMQSLQREIEESSKDYEKALESICQKYRIDLKVDKLNLSEGLITRATPVKKEEEIIEEDDNESTEDEE